MVLGNSILMKGGCLITDYCVLLQDNTSVEPAEAKTRWYMKTYYVVSCHPMFMHRWGCHPTFMHRQKVKTLRLCTGGGLPYVHVHYR